MCVKGYLLRIILLIFGLSACIGLDKNDVRQDTGEDEQKETDSEVEVDTGSEDTAIETDTDHPVDESCDGHRRTHPPDDPCRFQ